jgi:hypothetical protein
VTTPTLFNTVAPTPAAPAAAGPRPLVIGLDIALVNSGIAGPDWTDHIRTGNLRAEARLDAILEHAAAFYRHADLAVIEAPAFGRALQAGHDEMAAARWLIRLDLYRRGIPCAVVNPMSRTIYALGSGRPKHPESGRLLTAAEAKGAVREAIRERYGIETAGATRYDQADAFVLAAMGLHWLGYPLAEVPATHSRALDGVAWPTAVPLAAR